jgi:hypothetical protein
MAVMDPVVAGYDAVYSRLARSPTLAHIWREHALDRSIRKALNI